MIKALLFDFDGVILDSMSVRSLGFRAIFESAPQDKIEELIQYHQVNGGLSRFHKIHYFYETILNQQITDERVQELAEQFSQVMKEQLTDQSRLIQSTIDFIKSCHGHIPMHIVSGSEGNELRYLCGELGIDHYFITIEGSPTTKTKLVKDLLIKYQYDPAHCILIGDSINDEQAAIANDVTFYGFNNKSLSNRKHYIQNYNQDIHLHFLRNS